MSRGELGEVYERTRERVVDLVVDLDEATASITVPACSKWSSHDVIAHLAGTCADITTGNIVGAATDEWTAAQVEKRRDWQLRDILAEWLEVGPQVASMIDSFPGWYGKQVIADLATHEHDLRGALDKPGARNSDALGIGIEFLVGVMLRSAMGTLGLGPLDIDSGTKRWLVGTGEPPSGDSESWRAVAGSSDPLPASNGAPKGSLRVGQFELFRAITGRRSETQIRSYDWNVAPDPYMPAFGYGPFKMRSTDLVE